ncbi:MAG TPA: 2TM domain-containing protein [Flavobacterium sp.]|nr:2TM domain-containing protein [Flavobacterium sp.]
MENNQHELYEYARRRMKQKKRLYFHFILFFVGSLFFVIIRRLLEVYPEYHWDVWAIVAWAFFFILHFIRVFITDSFMNKNWERAQIDKMVAKQERRLQQLESKIDNTQL